MSVDELQTWPAAGGESPFRLPLVPHPESSSPHIRVFDGDDRFVVRLVPALQLSSSDALLPTTKMLHRELERFGVAVPPRVYVFGSRHRDGSPQAFIVARAVRGRALLDALEDEAALAPVVDALCVALLEYYDAKYQGGGPRLSDLKAEQFVYGTVDDVEAVWMVDLDPGYVFADPATTDARHLASLHWRVAEVETMVVEAERRGLRELLRARARFRSLLRSAGFDHPSARGRADALARGLGAGMPVDGAGWMQAQFRSEG